MVTVEAVSRLPQAVRLEGLRQLGCSFKGTRVTLGIGGHGSEWQVHHPSLVGALGARRLVRLAPAGFHDELCHSGDHARQPTGPADRLSGVRVAALCAPCRSGVKQDAPGSAHNEESHDFIQIRII